MSSAAEDPIIYKVVSVGAGVQSSYLAVTEEADYFIFADTGDESKATYEFIDNYLIPTMESQGKELTIVKWWELYDAPDNIKSMTDWYIWKNGIPTRQFRSCTERFKIRCIRKFLRNEGVEKADMLLGITTDEYKRMKDSDVKWITNKYPLIDKGLARWEVEKRGKEIFGVIPPKSGCRCCPYLPSRRFIEETEDDPEYRDKIILMEENAMKYNSKLILFKEPIRTIIDGKERQTSLDDYFDEYCDSGVCFI